jgi:hypothetical protein
LVGADRSVATGQVAERHHARVTITTLASSCG